MCKRMPTDADDEVFENQWRDDAREKQGVLFSHFLFNSAAQFSTTVIGFASRLHFCVRIKNLWQSWLTSYTV